MNILKQFLIGDILKKVETKKISLKKGDCSSFYTEKYNLPARTATTQNQGLSCFVPKDMATVLRNKISVSANGDFCAFWHDTDFTILQDSYALEGNGFELNEKRALYIISSMYRALGKKYNWNNKSGWEKIKKEFISLPIHNISCVDFNRIQDIVVRGGVDVDMTKIDTSTWKEFKVSDLFSVMTGDYDIQKSHINGIGTVVITAGETDNGILGKSDIKAKIVQGNTITVDMFGNCVYRDFEYKMVTHARVFALIPKIKGFNEISGLFITTLLGKLTTIFNYSNMCSWNKIKDFRIKLPVKEVEEIDFEYMEKYIAELEGQRIAELEGQRIAELEGYLMATGLNDYELTEEDVHILKTYIDSVSTGGGQLQNLDCLSLSQRCKIKFKEFRIGNLFEKLSLGKKEKHFDKKKDISVIRNNEFNLPLVNAKHGSNGIMYYGRKEDWDTATMCLDIVNDGAISAGDVYPQPHETSVLYNAYLIKPLFEYVSEEILIYLAAIIEKNIKYKYGYSNKAGWEKVKEDIIFLPITDVSDSSCKYHKEGYIPNFEYMEKYIRVMEKLVIKDVVKYKDLEIEKTKEILSIV